MFYRFVFCCFVSAVLLGNVVSTGSAAEPIYKGKTVTTLVGSSPGGAYDLVARIVAKHLPKHLPGAPTSIVQNMPGAGGLKVTNYIYNVAPKDGTVIALLNQGLGMSKILTTNADYVPSKFEWIGRVAATTALVVVHKSAQVQSMEEMKTKETIFGATGKGSQTYMVPTVLRTILGLKTRTILGYKSVPQVFAAMERGEVHARTGDIVAILSSRPDWLEDGTLRILGEFSLDDKPTIPNVPLVLPMAPDAESRNLLELIGAFTAFGFPYGAPPGTDAEAVKLLREGFLAVMNDPAFINDMKRAKMSVSPESPDYLEGIAKKFDDVAPDLAAKAKKAIEW